MPNHFNKLANFFASREGQTCLSEAVDPQFSLTLFGTSLSLSLQSDGFLILGIDL